MGSGMSRRLGSVVMDHRESVLRIGDAKENL